jgi:hypothetical protein
MAHCDPSILKRLRGLTGGAAALAVCGLLAAATAALAMPPTEGGSGFSEGGARTAAQPAGSPRQLRQVAAARALAPGGNTHFSPPVTPLDAATGLIIAGSVHATWGSGQADLFAQIISNNRPSGTTGDLTLHLVATTSPPPVGAFSGFDMASADLGTLPAGTAFDNVDTGSIAFLPPGTNGCYYVSEVLEENGAVVDVRTFPLGGTPENTGYDHFPFGTTCPAATFCTRSSTGACLLGGRFQVTAVYENDVTGSGAASVMGLGGTRLESNESVFYYFTDSSNFEMGIKVLDACSFTNTFWVFIGGLTNQGWDVNVLDTQTGNHKHYANALGVTTVTVTDTAALPCP